MPALKILIFSVISCLLLSVALPVFAASIVINEFSSASDPEWVELYNPTDQETSLKGVALFLDANPSTTQKFIFCDTDKITAKSFKLINRPSGSFWLSNAGDTLILKKEDDTIDSISYGTGQTLKAPLATQSATRSPDGAVDWILAVPTPQGGVAVFTCPEPAAEVPQPVTPASSPKIDWALEDKIYVAKEFKTTKLELSNFDINTEYFLKLRAGSEEGKLTKIQTKNGGAFLSDGEAWSKFPLLKTDGNGKWAGEAKGLLSEGKPDGKYKILLRLRKKDTDTYLESDLKEITFLPEIIEAAAVVTNKPQVLAATVTARINLATPASLPAPPSPKPQTSPTSPTNPAPFFIASGLILIAGAIIALWKWSPELFAKLKIWGKN